MGICACWCEEPLYGYPWLRNTLRGLLMTGAAICRDINIRGVNISHNNGGVNININIRGANWTFHHLQPLVPLSPTTWHLTHTASCIFFANSFASAQFGSFKQPITWSLSKLALTNCVRVCGQTYAKIYQCIQALWRKSYTFLLDKEKPLTEKFSKIVISFRMKLYVEDRRSTFISDELAEAGNCLWKEKQR